MARHDAMRKVQAFQWPEEPAERDIAVDPFSLRQFSRLDIDRPLPIPSVSVSDPHVSPARFGCGSGSGSAPVSAASSPRVSIAGRLNALVEATGWDDAPRPVSPVQQAHSVALSGGNAAAAGGETELTDGGFDVVLSSSSGRKANEPQRWGSDVPLIAAAGAEEDSAGYSFPNARGKSGRGEATRHAGESPFSCCMYVPGLSRKGRPPAAPVPPPARPSPGALIGRAATAEKLKPHTDDPAGAARQSTVSLAASLERFDCGSLSTSSWGDLDLDGEVSSSSCFDLPLELILGGEDDESDLPVCAAFVFDSDGIRKSVLKKRLADGVVEARRPSLGRVSMGASGRTSAAHARVSLKSRPPSAPTSP